MNCVSNIQARLFALQDLKYRDFQAKLMPDIPKETIIGIRTPLLRGLAKELDNDPETALFLKTLPHDYYEENNLHAFLIERIKQYDECLQAINAFLPYIDNWATCDSLSPAVFGKCFDALKLEIPKWLASGRCFTVRFGIEMLMKYGLDERFTPSFPETVARIRSADYYVNMMIAWYFATALAKQYQAVLPFLENRRLAVWTHNKTIQKAIESYRVSSEQKEYLRTLKIKPDQENNIENRYL